MVDDRAPFGCVSARTRREAWELWPWAFGLLVKVDLRPSRDSAATEAIVSADAIDAGAIGELFESSASARLVKKVSAALTEPAENFDIWASMRRRREGDRA
jgi:hypothetical protein